MVRRNVVETLMGAFVLLVAAMFTFISYKSGNIAPTSSGYQIIAKFNEIGSLSVGSDVRVGGIKVGAVTKQFLDPDNYMAVVQITIDDSIRLPRDSSATIIGDGLLGGKYIAIEAGGDDKSLKEGDEIKYTQDAVSLEQLIGKFAFGGVAGGEDAQKTE
ncbi:outer membrane lipid asymmetry maintenance protein MlaD [Rickettsiales bacterium]|nr:outer membrane lipid asymmetry maintenance protein MlaD [Rickettsiales bacterium]